MRKGYKITLGILTIMILITITIGTSYSFYSVGDEQNGTNNLATACFNFTFNDNDGNSVIKLNTDGKYAYPMSDSKAIETITPYTFTVTNTCDTKVSTKNISYDIVLSTLTDQTEGLDVKYIKYKLDDTGLSSTLNTKVYDKLPQDIITEHKIDKSYDITGNESLTLAPGTSKEHKLYLWIDESAGNDIMGKSFTGEVLVYAYMGS